MGVASGFDGAPDGFGRAIRALLASAVVPVPLTSKTLFQADGQSLKKVVSLFFRSLSPLPFVERPVPHKLGIVPGCPEAIEVICLHDKTVD